jgi:hypothetical protein
VSLPAQLHREPAPLDLPVSGPWEAERSTAGASTAGASTAGPAHWTATLPVEGVVFGASSRLPPPGMEVRWRGEALRYLRAPAKSAPSWALDGDRLLLRLPEEPTADGAPPAARPPAAGEVSLRYPPAAARERAWDPAGQPLADLAARVAFVQRSAGVGDESAHGTLLPAPAAVTWTLDLPPAARLRARAQLLPAQVHVGPASDGAVLRLKVDEQTVFEAPLAEGTSLPLDIDLGAWAGPGRSLRLEADPGPAGDNEGDALFVAAPTVLVPSPAPRRIVMLFVDTLRADHLGLYGYSRPTSPRIDRLGAEGRVFLQAHSVAPWTLPAARTLLTGRLPDAWDPAAALPATFGAAGWRTVALVSNPWLGRESGWAEGWSSHSLRAGARAAPLADEALQALSAADQDTLLLLHFMDTHLPYKEGAPYDTLFAGDTPEELRRPWNGATLRNLHPTPERAAVLHDYVSARYDQNIRAVDDAVGRVLDALGPDDTVLLFADHGEELWDHGGVEHGHSVHEELLHIPLVLRGPGVPQGEEAAPVSLLDLAATVTDLAGLPAGPLGGRSLLQGGSAAPPVFGWTLYGEERFGLLRGDDKWELRGSGPRRFDLAADPHERDALPERGDEADLLATALGRPVGPVWRLAAPGTLDSGSLPEATFTLEAEGGVRAAWPRADWLGRAAAPLVTAQQVRLERGPGEHIPHELFVQAGPGKITVQMTVGPTVYTAESTGGTQVFGPRGHEARLDLVRFPSEPPALRTVSDEGAAALQALGYVDP